MVKNLFINHFIQEALSKMSSYYFGQFQVSAQPAGPQLSTQEEEGASNDTESSGPISPNFSDDGPCLHENLHRYMVGHQCSVVPPPLPPRTRPTAVRRTRVLKATDLYKSSRLRGLMAAWRRSHGMCSMITPLRPSSAYNHHAADENPGAGANLLSLADGDPSRDGEPPYSDRVLVCAAINGSPDGKLTLAEVREAIRARYRFFNHDEQKWNVSCFSIHVLYRVLMLCLQNNVRHLLSIHKDLFENLPGTEPVRCHILHAISIHI